MDAVPFSALHWVGVYGDRLINSAMLLRMRFESMSSGSGRLVKTVVCTVPCKILVTLTANQSQLDTVL